MTSRKLIAFLSLILLDALFAGTPPAVAGSSHARIIRLSLVQGDVRFARETHGDPLTDSSATWETASLNLPIRQGYVLATDSGRAEVEFENGAMAFLKENTVLEFYDLSLHDGDRTTRLVLRQGSASFYVNPAGGDYFSVTGGDFTAEATSRTSFRVDNYDDGSTVEALKGTLSVVHKGNATPLARGQSLSIKTGDDSSLTVSGLPNEDDFDRWVSGRIDSVSTATNAALQYTSSPYYASGFADLYTYGAFSNCGAYGYGWRPFGAGIGWSPFTTGQWFWDQGFGWTWMSAQPWGWAPYHYGGWFFDNSCGGWFYSPPAFYGYPGTVGPRRRFPPVVHPPHPVYHPATAVFVRNNGKVGVVPIHPLDQKGKTPQNLEHGVFSVSGPRGFGEPASALAPGQKWETLKSAPREALVGSLATTTPPTRVSRTVLEGQSGARAVSLGKDSSIAYDAREHRFVNTNPSSSENTKEIHSGSAPTGVAASVQAGNATARTVTPTTAVANSSHNPQVPSAARTATAPPARAMTPPPAPHYSGGSGGSSGGTGGSFGGSRPSSSSGSGRSSPAPAPSAPASHPSSGRPH
ncbi:MAG TPA: FecR family protein [Candidatus Acidoferrum sp.]|nr:FecR family protein [Candidatus Acidoferrum sp.]